MNLSQEELQDVLYVLKSKAFQDAFKELHDEIHATWAGSDTTAKREEQWMRLQALACVRKRMLAKIENAANAEKKDGFWRKRLRELKEML